MMSIKKIGVYLVTVIAPQKPRQQEANLPNLPCEILEMIADELPDSDRLQLGASCRSVFDVIDHCPAWRGQEQQILSCALRTQNYLKSAELFGPSARRAFLYEKALGKSKQRFGMQHCLAARQLEEASAIAQLGDKFRGFVPHEHLREKTSKALFKAVLGLSAHCVDGFKSELEAASTAIKLLHKNPLVVRHSAVFERRYVQKLFENVFRSIVTHDVIPWNYYQSHQQFVPDVQGLSVKSREKVSYDAKPRQYNFCLRENELFDTPASVHPSECRPSVRPYIELISACFDAAEFFSYTSSGASVRLFAHALDELGRSPHVTKTSEDCQDLVALRDRLISSFRPLAEVDAPMAHEVISDSFVVI